MSRARRQIRQQFWSLGGYQSIGAAIALALLLAGCGSGSKLGGALPPDRSLSESPRFPWPPPAPSARAELTDHLVTYYAPFKTLGDVNEVLQTGLRAAGYSYTSYFAVPKGFALVTQLERIESDGAPRPDRWATDPKRTKVFSLRDYLRALFTANEGHYRTIAIIVTDAPFTQKERPVTPEEARRWLAGGYQKLPPEIAALPWRAGVTCSALIYEFVQEQQKEPRLQLPSGVAGDLHLDRSGLMAKLRP